MRQARESLKQEVVAWSHSKDWETARQEWRLAEIRYRELKCPCGQFPIHEVCVMRNRINGHQLLIGNECVFHFIGIDVRSVFAALKRVRADLVASFNEAALNQAWSERIINGWEMDFYMDIRRLKFLSEKQAAKKTQINSKILRRWLSDFKVERPLALA